MTLAEVEELVARQAHAWAAEDIELALGDFAPDAVFQVPGRRFVGRDQIRQGANGFFARATDIKVTILRIVYDGVNGAVEWRWEEIRRASGMRHQTEDAIVFEIRAGKIVYWRAYFDTAQLSLPQP